MREKASAPPASMTSARPARSTSSGVGDGIVAGGAGRGDHGVGPGEAQLAGHVGGDHVAGVEGDELGPHALELAGQEAVVEALDLERLARGGAHGNAGPLGFDRLGIEPRVLQGHAGGGDGEQGGAAERRGILAPHPGSGIEPPHLRSQMGAEGFGVERLDRREAAAAREQPLPHLVPARSERGDQAEAGHRDGSVHLCTAWVASTRSASRSWTKPTMAGRLSISL